MSSRHSKLGAGRKDAYYYRAKEAGYRSRAAFKLLHLDQKFGFLSSAKCVVDLCAAPGGWSQVAARHMPVGSLIIAVDLVPIQDIPGIKTLVSDITTQHCRTNLKRMLRGWEVDVVMNDGAPNMGASWSKDAYNQSELVLHSLKLASELLRKGGTFVTKVFRSRDYAALLFAMRSLFDTVTATKPPSSRDTSAELFVVCSGFKAPASLDTRLLDPEVLFADEQQEEGHATIATLTKRHGRKQRPSRDGYEGPIFKTIDAPRFVAAPFPLDLFEGAHVLRLQPPSGSCKPTTRLAWQAVAESPETTVEIRELASDLQSAGRQDILLLLKWRRGIRAALKAAGKLDSLALEHGFSIPKEVTDEAQRDVAHSTDEDDEDRKASAVRDKLRRSEKAMDKKRRKRELKSLERAAASRDGGLSSDVAELEGRGLFSLRGTNAPAESESEEPDSVDDDTSDSDERQERYMNRVERALEATYAVKQQQQREREQLQRKINEDRSPSPSPETRATQMAVGQRMLRRDMREEMIDDSYNRFCTFDDDADLPAWFREDEKRHFRPIPPVTREEVAEQRKLLQEIAERPPKKVLEARARKKLRAYRRVRQLQSKATAIEERQDMTEREKLSAIENLAKKLLRKEQKKGGVVRVGKAFRGDMGKRKTVDRRMRADGKGHALVGGVGKKQLRKQGLLKSRFRQAKAEQKKRSRRRGRRF